MIKKNYTRRGFTLVEVIVGTAIFIIVATAVYSSFVVITKLARNNQARSIAVQLANEQFEIVRNLPYTDVGIKNAIPPGVLTKHQEIVRGGIVFNVLLTVRNINLATTTIQASDKLVEVEINCLECASFEPVKLTGQISPANLQSADIGGALVVQVFNGDGEPVQGATVDVESVATSTITNVDETNNFGILNIIGVPFGINMYKIVVTKDGYSTEETFAIGGAGNPDPSKPNVTVLNQQVSQISFAIDKLSSLHFSSVSPLCAPVPNIDFSLVGAKNIGVGVPKYSSNKVTNVSGSLDLNSMEWDTYTITPTDAAYDVAGINPDSPFSLNPDTNQEVQLVVVPKNGNSIMVSVVDSSTFLPISSATVTLSKPGFNSSKITGQGYLQQVDWSLGSGQEMYVDQARYFADNASVDVATSSGDVVLRDFFGLFNTNATGTLESSTFDTGTSSNFYSLSWTPNNQPLHTGANSLKFQFASATSTDTIWDFLGPDGTADSYYTVSGSPINVVHNDKQYARYRAYLSTETATATPKLSDINFAYTSGCTPPGQVLFQNLSTVSYDLNVSKNGYIVFTGQVDIANGWQRITVPLLSQ